MEMEERLTRIPWPSSDTWMSLRPPSLTTTLIEVEWASRLFSISSLTAETGRWMTSPAAIRFTTDSSKRRIFGGSLMTTSSSTSISILIRLNSLRSLSFRYRLGSVETRVLKSPPFRKGLDHAMINDYYFFSILFIIKIIFNDIK